MKKITIFASVFATLSIFASCNKEQPATNNAKVTVEFSVADLTSDTKAVKTNWEDGDKINIWFNDVSSPNYCYWQQTPHLVLTRSAGAWVSSEVDEALLSASGTFNAVYESSNTLFGSAINNIRAYLPNGTSFKFSGHANNTKTIKFPIICTNNDVAYTYDSGTRKISGTISNWVVDTQLQVVVTGLTYVADRYAMTFDNNVYYSDCLIYINDDISLSGSSNCKGIYDSFTSYWIEGKENSDGTVFIFKNTKDTDTKDYTIYLVDKIAKKVYSFTKNTAIATTYTSVKGIKIDFNKFGDITSEHPLD